MFFITPKLSVAVITLQQSVAELKRLTGALTTIMGLTSSVSSSAKILSTSHFPSWRLCPCGLKTRILILLTALIPLSKSRGIYINTVYQLHQLDRGTSNGAEPAPGEAQASCRAKYLSGSQGAHNHHICCLCLFRGWFFLSGIKSGLLTVPAPSPSFTRGGVKKVCSPDPPQAAASYLWRCIEQMWSRHFQKRI